jgi:prepilin-type N-terminal cleavage/methylation domain-containing protein
MKRSGFTTIELIMVVVIMGVIATIGFPRIKDALEKQSRRSMRVGIVSMMATARGAAVARGCMGTVHFVSGPNSRAWVTACSTRPGALATARDTLGGPYYTEARWGHRFQSGKDEINYTPRGMRQTLTRTVILIRTKGDVTRDSVVVNEIGRVVYP